MRPTKQFSDKNMDNNNYNISPVDHAFQFTMMIILVTRIFVQVPVRDWEATALHSALLYYLCAIYWLYSVNPFISIRDSCLILTLKCQQSVWKECSSAAQRSLFETLCSAVTWLPPSGTCAKGKRYTKNLSHAYGTLHIFYSNFTWCFKFLSCCF